MLVNKYELTHNSTSTTTFKPQLCFDPANQKFWGENEVLTDFQNQTKWDNNGF